MVVDRDTDDGTGSFTALTIAPDGKLIAAGEFLPPFAGDATDFAVARFEADGSPDTAFADAGIQTEGLERSHRVEQVTAVQLQPDGRIVVTGSLGAGDASTASGWFALMRYLPTGAIDPSFSGDGRQVTTDSALRITSRSRDSVLQADGDIVLAGYSSQGGETSDDFALARYDGGPALPLDLEPPPPDDDPMPTVTPDPTPVPTVEPSPTATPEPTASPSPSPAPAATTPPPTIGTVEMPAEWRGAAARSTRNVARALGRTLSRRGLRALSARRGVAARFIAPTAGRVVAELRSVPRRGRARSLARGAARLASPGASTLRLRRLGGARLQSSGRELVRVRFISSAGGSVTRRSPSRRADRTAADRDQPPCDSPSWAGAGSESKASTASTVAPNANAAAAKTATARVGKFG